MKPTIQQQRDYLFQTYFGVMGTEVYQFVSRAYRDLNRTLRGISQRDKDNKQDILSGAKGELKQRLGALRHDAPSKDAAAAPTKLTRARRTKKGGNDGGMFS